MFFFLSLSLSPQIKTTTRITKFAWVFKLQKEKRKEEEEAQNMTMKDYYQPFLWILSIIARSINFSKTSHSFFKLFPFFPPGLMNSQSEWPLNIIQKKMEKTWKNTFSRHQEVFNFIINNAGNLGMEKEKKKQWNKKMF